MIPRFRLILFVVLLLPPLSIRAQSTDRNGDSLPTGALTRLGSLRLRHPGSDHCLAFSPDNKWLASGSEESIRIWNLTDGKEQFRLPVHREEGAHCLAFSHDGKWLAVGDGDHRLTVWQLSSRKPLLSTKLPNADYVQHFVFSPDDTTLSWLTTEGWVHRWQLKPKLKLKSKWRLKFERCRHIVSNAKGQLLVLSDLVSSLEVQNLDTGKRIAIRLPPRKNLFSARLIQRGQCVACTFELGTKLHFYDVAKSRWMKPPITKLPMRCRLSVSSDGNTLACWNKHSLKDHPRIWLWNAKLRQIQKRLTEPKTSLSTVIISPDGKYMAGSGGSHMLHLIDGITGKARHFQGHHYAISGIAISHDEKTVFTGSADQTVRFWNATTGEQARLVRNNDHFIDGLALSSNGKYLIAQRTERIGDGEQSFVPIDTRTGKQKQWNQVLPIQARHRSFHINGSTLTEQEELGVMVRDLWTLKRIRSLQFKKRKWRAIQLLPDGEHVLAIGEKPDGPWTIWNVKTRQEVWRFRQQPLGLPAVSPDGSLLAMAGPDSKIHLWNVHTKKKQRSFKLKTDEDLGPLVFSPDGLSLIQTTPTGLIAMEVLSRKKRLQFIGHREKISCIALSRSGRLIVTGSESTTALVWDGTGLGSNAKAVDAKEFPALWNDLQSNDACQAHQAIWRFVLSQKQSLAWLKEKLPTVKAIDRKQMLRWIDQLDDASFQVRQNAVGHIQLAESRAKEPLEQALKQKPTLHQRRQIQLLLKKLRNPFQEPSVLRSARVIEIFAHMQSKESLQHLRHLATRGVPTSCITKLARRVLRSLR